MTENEATKDIKRQLLEIDSEDADITLSTESLKMAIQALEEIQSYRAIGTVEELREMRSGDFSEHLLNMGYTKGLKDGYNKAIDEFLRKVCEKYTEEESKNNYVQYCCSIKHELAEIAEDLKGEKQ